MTAPARSTRRASILLGFLVLAACDKTQDTAPGTAGEPSATASSQSVDEQLADLASYRLTMDKIDKYMAAQRNIMLKMGSMSPAEREAMEGRSGGNDANASIDDMARNIEREPIMKAAVRDAGLSPREFTMITMSLMQTAMASSVAKMRPNDNQDSLIREMKANPENVKFFRDNEAELVRKQTQLADEMKKLGATDDGE